MKFANKKDFSSGGLAWDPDKKQLLLVYVENLSGKKVWTFPKGHPEKGETDEEAALREVQEETGWACSIRKFLMDSKYFYVHEKIRYQKTVRWYVMTPEKRTGTFQEGEILDCAWASLEKAATLITYDSDKALLTKLKSVL